MKWILILFMIGGASVGNAQAKKNPILTTARRHLQIKEYRKASTMLHKLIFSNGATAEDKMTARYLLGLALIRMNMHQTAAFPLIVAAKEGSSKMSQKSFENLAMISDFLGDTGLLDYTLKKLDANDLGELAKEIYLIRMGQALMREQKYTEAAAHLQQALALRSENEEALYTLALVYLKQNKTAEALPLLQKIYDRYFTRSILDVKRGAAAMALGRALYQARRWEEAASLYREIPKDHALYREAQMELSWSLFRMAKFRSAMSTIQTLHTPFYENFYNPESLILRGIILLFACQNEEADKALLSFENNYASAHSILVEVGSSNKKPEYFYSQIEEAQRHLKELQRGSRSTYGGQIPFFIVRALMESAPLKNKLTYLEKIKLEKIRVTKTFTRSDEEPLKQYALKILNSRQKNASVNAGLALQAALVAKAQDLSLLAGDLSLVRYEVLAAKKKAARAEYIRKVNNSDAERINQSDSRDFYIKNGYRYWPFEGEYWRDEIGNYQYLGVNRCDKD